MHVTAEDDRHQHPDRSHRERPGHADGERLHSHALEHREVGVQPNRRHGRAQQDLRRFPNETSITRLREVGVTFVVVHRELYSADEWTIVEPRLAQFPQLRLAHEDGDGRVYAVLPN